MIRHRFRSTFVLASLAIVLLLFPLSGAVATPQSAPQAAAMAGAVPDITAGFWDSGIIIVWNTPKQVSEKDVLQYLIWRDAAPGTPGAMPVGAVDAATSPPFAGPGGSWDHRWIDQPFPYAFDYWEMSSKNDLVPVTAVAQGCMVGMRHEYWITCTYRVNSPRARKPEYRTAGPIYTGGATLVSRPVCHAPGGPLAADYVDLSHVTFLWEGAAGADQYVIEVSPTPDFARDKTWVDTVYQPTSQDGTLYAKAYVNALKNADTGAVVPELANVPPGGIIFWRVGCRNRLDTPGPIPAGPSPMVSGTKNTRYIYSDPTMTFMFMTLPDLPPPPPDPGGGEDPPPPPL